MKVFVFFVLFTALLMVCLVQAGRGVRAGVETGSESGLPRMCERSGAGIEAAEGRDGDVRPEAAEWAREVRRVPTGVGRFLETAACAMRAASVDGDRLVERRLRFPIGECVSGVRAVAARAEWRAG